MAGEEPGNPDLPSDEELKFLSRLPAKAMARISLEGTKAEAEFHEHAMCYHLPSHEDDYDPGTVEDKKYKLIGMCDRLTHRVLWSYFEELKLLPIPPGTVRRLLNYILTIVTVRLFRQKWREYIPPRPDESETGFLGAAIEHQKPLIEGYYAEALQIHEKRLSDYLKSGAGPQWPASRPEPPMPKPEPIKPDQSELELFGRLSREACLRIDAYTAEMMAEYTPIMERARGVKAQIVTFCEMVAYQYDVHARECLEVVSSVEEFELALRRDVPKVLVWKFEHERWLTEEMSKELSTGMTMFVQDMPIWTKATPGELEEAWHVGAILGESIRNLFLQWRAEAYRRAACGGFQPQTASSQIETGGGAAGSKQPAVEVKGGAETVAEQNGIVAAADQEAEVTGPVEAAGLKSSGGCLDDVSAQQAAQAIESESRQDAVTTGDQAGDPTQGQLLRVDMEAAEPSISESVPEPVGGENEHTRVGSAPLSRVERLQAFITAHPGTTYADIQYSAPVHKPDFSKWRKDKLPATSLMSQRIEDVLAGRRSLKKKPRKRRTD